MSLADVFKEALEEFKEESQNENKETNIEKNTYPSNDSQNANLQSSEIPAQNFHTDFACLCAICDKRGSPCVYCGGVFCENCVREHYCPNDKARESKLGFELPNETPSEKERYVRDINPSSEKKIEEKKKTKTTMKRMMNIIKTKEI